MMSLFCLNYNNYVHAQAVVTRRSSFLSWVRGYLHISLMLDTAHGTHSARFSHCACVIAYTERIVYRWCFTVSKDIIYITAHPQNNQSGIRKDLTLMFLYKIQF